VATIEMNDDMTFDEEAGVANLDNLVVNEEEKQFGSHTFHRRTLNHISQDEALSKCYTVPNFKTSDVKNLAANARQMMERQVCGKTKSEWIGILIPCYNWLRVYDCRSILITDILAGIAVGVMAVPQSMSYAKLAGLPVEYGLYSALFPIWAYAIFGTSRQLAVGPVSLVSLMLGSGLSNQMAKLGISSDDDNYMEVLTTLAIQTSFVVGLLNIGMGLFRLGFVTVFLSHAVISGFISGAALISGMSQLKHILGIKANGDNVEKIIESICENIGGFNYKSFLMGSFSLVALLLIKPLSKKFPTQKWLKAIGPIFITVVTIAITWGFNLDKQGLPIIASIPAGFPNFTAGLWFPMDKFGDMITTSVSITIIGFMESIVIAKSLAAKHNYEVDSSMELIGLGMSNFVGSMFQAYPSAGSFSRSAVNNDSGAQSGVSGIVTAFLVGLVLLFLTDVFEYLVSALQSLTSTFKLALILQSATLSLSFYCHFWSNQPT
jgi:sulfate transporter 4